MIFMAGCPFCQRCRSFLIQYVNRRKNGLGGGIRKSHLRRKGLVGKSLPINDVKRKVQIRRDSYERNKKLIERVIMELNDIFFIDDS